MSELTIGDTLSDTKADLMNPEVINCFIKAPTGPLLNIQLTGAEQLCDVRTNILEATEVCYITSYNLSINGRILPEYKELRECPDFKDGCIIDMIPVGYDDRTARFHVSRFQDLLFSKLDSLILTNAFAAKKIETPSFEPPIPKKQQEDSTISSNTNVHSNSNSAFGKKNFSTSTSSISKSTNQNFPSFAFVQIPNNAEDIINDLDRSADADSDFENLIIVSTSTSTSSKKQQQKSKSDIPISSNLSGSDFDPLEIPTSVCGLKKLLAAASCQVPIHCLIRLGYSGWNPAPGARRMAGDLFYLEATTLEDLTFHITGCTRGFYVNHSNALRFNALQNDKYKMSPTLLGLFWEISPKFRQNFVRLLQMRASLHPYEALPILHSCSVATTRVQWAGLDESAVTEMGVARQPYDAIRAQQDLLLHSFGFDAKTPQVREWNEEYQNIRNYVCKSDDEKVLRDRLLVKTHQEFTEAAVKGAKAVVDGLLVPLNAQEHCSQHVWMHNQIFFSIVCDTRPIFRNYGGDEGARKMAKIDLNGSAAYERLDVDGLHTVMTAVVDYKGRRVLAQALIQGMVQNQAESFVYGLEEAAPSQNEGDPKKPAAIMWDAKTHEKLTEAAKRLYIKSSPVLNCESVSERDGMLPVVHLASAIETKAFVGWDKRTYMLDVIRPSPRDCNWLHVPTAILRTELVKSYIERQKSEFLESISSTEKTEKEENPTTTNELILETFEPTLFDVNCFTEQMNGHKSALSQTDRKRDEENVEALARFLVDTAIPNAIAQVAEGQRSVTDGPSLVELLHEHGINMRYLGHVAMRANRVPHMQAVCIEEMVARAAKHELNDSLRKCELSNIAQIVSQFLNSLFGAATEQEVEISEEQSGSEKKKKKSSTAAKKQRREEGHQHIALRRSLIEQIKRRFQFDLTSDYFCSPQEVKKDEEESTHFGAQQHYRISHLSALRNLCLKTGIQIACKRYDFCAKCPFEASDVLDVQPIVFHHVPVCKEAESLLASVSDDLFNHIQNANGSQSGELEAALQKTVSALQCIQTVYGPISSQYLNGLKTLCQVYVQAGDLETALLTFHKALIISRRINGVDHHSTIHFHQTMGAMLSTMERPQLALKHCLRAAYVNALISPTPNMDSTSLLTCLGGLYHELEDPSRALVFHKEGLKCAVDVFGEMSLQTALLYQQFATFLSRGALAQHRSAMEFQKRALRILQSLHQEEDSRECFEASKLLEEFTQAAVEQQKAHAMSQKSSMRWRQSGKTDK